MSLKRFSKNDEVNKSILSLLQSIFVSVIKKLFFERLLVGNYLLVGFYLSSLLFFGKPDEHLGFLNVNDQTFVFVLISHFLLALGELFPSSVYFM